MKKSMLAAAAAVAFTLVSGHGAVTQAADVEVGTLNCTVAGGAGFIIGSSKGMKCVFDPAGDGPTERYTGSIDKLGVDIGFTNETKIVWAVLAPSGDVPSGALAGSYGGASAEATVGAGVGANALVGGLESSFTLQPLSVQGQTGLNVAGGLARITLRVN
ncbi:MAG: DUF992 domain-containing protein [Hyphomicrobiales bacterium]